MGLEAIFLGDWALTLDVHDDPSDTWAHSCGTQFGGKRLGRFEFKDGWRGVESGEFRLALCGRGEFGSSRVWARPITPPGDLRVHLHLAVVWSEVRRMLRLRVAAPVKLQKRLDLVSGGPLERPLDGQEYPLNGALVVGDKFLFLYKAKYNSGASGKFSQ
jgi:hypothetical protein